MAVSATDEAAGVCVSGLVPVEDQQQVQVCVCVCYGQLVPLSNCRWNSEVVPPVPVRPAVCVCMCDDMPST